MPTEPINGRQPEFSEEISCAKNWARAVYRGRKARPR
jgi:hypothetical protein